MVNMINVGEFLNNVKEAQKTYSLNVTEATKLVEGINSGKYASTVLKEIKDSREKASKHTIGDNDSEVAFKIDSENGDITFNGKVEFSEVDKVIVEMNEEIQAKLKNIDENEKWIQAKIEAEKKLTDELSNVFTIFINNTKDSVSTAKAFSEQIMNEIKRQKGGR